MGACSTEQLKRPPRLTIVTVETDCGAVWVTPKAAEQDWVLVIKRTTQLDLSTCAQGISVPTDGSIGNCTL